MNRLEIAEGPRLPLEELVLYELHVGTFSPEGTFAGAVPRLPALRELGVTANEERATLILRRGRATLRADFASLTVELNA